MIHWFIFNFVVMIVTGLLLLERFLHTQFDFLPVVAGVLFIVTLVLFIKDVWMFKGH